MAAVGNCTIYPDAIWCGPRGCETARYGNTTIAKHELHSCPRNQYGALYYDNGIGTSGKWPSYDLKRLCSREITPLVGDAALRGCSMNRIDASLCPLTYCGGGARASVDYMKTLCSKGNAIFDDSDCRDWKSIRPVEYKDALKKADGNKSQTARLLGLTRNALRYRLTQMGIES